MIREVYGNTIETVGYHGEAVPYSHRITPERVRKPGTDIVRDRFRVHWDNGDDGSIGCIAIRSKHDFEEFELRKVRPR